MALQRVSINVTGDERVERAFKATGREVEDMREPLTVIMTILRQAARKQIDSEGVYATGKWRPLNPDYDEWKRRHYPGRGMLVQTGAMRRALTSVRAKGAVRRISKRRLVYGVTGEIGQRAEYHQFGEGHNPARRMVTLTMKDRREIDRAFADWLNDIRRGNFGTER